MPRKPTLKAAEPIATGVVEDAIREDLKASDTLGALVTQRQHQVVIYNRDEALTRLRGLMANGTQIMLEIGATLEWIRQHEPEADFREVVEAVGLDVRTAGRFMQAGRKFQLALNDDQRAAFRDLSRGKLYELLVLDDEQVAELADGLPVAGLTLDDIDTMSTSELRRTLREERAKAKVAEETKARQLADKNARQDALEEELDKLRHGGRDTEKQLALEREQAAVKAFSEASLEVLGAIAKFDQAVADCLAERTEARVTLTEQSTVWLFQRIAEIATQRGMAVDFESIVTPEWARALAPAKKAA